MPVFPSIYRAKITRVLSRRRVSALIPQVFGEAPVEITSFLGVVPTTPRMGWVVFQGGNPEFPVFATGGSVEIAASVDDGGDTGGGSELRQRTYVWSNNTTTSDPGHGVVKCNANDPEDATELYVSVYDAGGQASVGGLSLVAGDEITLYEGGGNLASNVRYVIGDVTNHGYQWFSAPVTVSEFNGYAPKNNSSVIVAGYVTTAGSGSGTNEVWIGPLTPTDPDVELWVDTDAPDPGAPAWSAGTLLNGWYVQVGDMPMQYRRIGDIVYYRGYVRNPGVSVAGSIMVFPTNFRPPYFDAINVGYVYGTGGGTYGVTTLGIYTDGRLWYDGAKTNVQFLSIHGDFSVTA